MPRNRTLNLLFMAAVCVIKFTITESRGVGNRSKETETTRDVQKCILKNLGAFGAMLEFCGYLPLLSKV